VITQVLTRTSLIRVGGEYTLVEGLQHNPYRNVYAGGTNVPEIHPGDRTRQALFVKVNQYFGNRSSVRVNYRYYEDDWGVVSHTYGVKLNQMIKDGVIVRYRYRYYDQSAATFHRDEYETVDGIGGFLSADYRMGRTEAHLFGGRLDFNLGNLPGHSRFLSYLDLSVKYERYFNSSNFSANVFEAGLRARLQ